MNNTKVNPNGLAIFNTLKENEGHILAFAEIASLAKIDAKTGYLTSAKKIAKENGYLIKKCEDAITVTIATSTTYPNGLVVNGEKTATLDGYTLAKAE